ncbi:hypothetical protein J437_LFUL010670 [Ladona fulva]|uniref:Type II methyltransferase M.TaqI-like domain-containing protein n=1 Tax=Ladona fulva TaxID=123851 RepID=A0A8K0KA98_LADFU|nr:hypothetical protein J437_LFUL010670 [Ladona fulva]
MLQMCRRLMQGKPPQATLRWTQVLGDSLLPSPLSVVAFFLALHLRHILSLKRVVCTAVDQSELACRIAKKNASAYNLNNRVKIIWAKLNKEGKIIKGVKENEDTEDVLKEYDIIVSNPPYVRHKDIFHLQPEILLYEDLRALNGGEDGLDIVKPLLKFASKALKSKEISKIGGALFIEVDPNQPGLLEKWLTTQGKSFPLTLQKVHQDLFGKDRFIEFVKN